MYQAIYYDRMTRMIHLWDDDLGYNTFPYEKYAYRENEKGRNVTIDGTRVSKVHKWDESEVKAGLIWEADISPTTRVLVDFYKDDDTPSRNCNIGFWDIETEILEGFPDWKKPKNKVTAVAFFDKSNNQHYVFILDEKKTLEYREYDNVKIVPCETEAEVMKQFLTTYRAANIHILTDWNGEQFDVPYFYNRTLKVLDEDWANMLSPIDQVYYNEQLEKYEIAGVAHLDYLPLYKKYSVGERPSYRLGEIGKLEVGIDKISYEGNLDTLYKNDIEKFIQYNLNDNYIIEALEKKLKYIDISRGTSHTCHTAYQDVVYATRVLDGAILTYAKRNNLVVPTKPVTITSFRPDKKAEGAFVKDPIVGRYRYLVDFDATSLYPSIIRSLNISSETKMFTVLSDDGMTYTDLIDDKEYKVKTLYNTIETTTGAKIKKLIKDKNYSFSCNSTAYRQDKRGIIPQVLDVWFAKRKEYSALANKFHKEGDMEQFDFYDRRQYIQKILINSLYGALLQSGFRYYDLENGESVTRSGKRIILFAEKCGNRWVNNIINSEEPAVVYCDTDSIFIQLQKVLEHYNIDIEDHDSCKNKILELIPDIYKHINTAFDLFCKEKMNLDKHEIEFKQEYIIRTGFWIKKKNYVMWLINQKGRDIDKIDIKGLAVVRSSFAPAFKNTMMRVIKDILNYESQSHIEGYMRTFKNEMKNEPLMVIANPTSLKDIKKWTIPGEYSFMKGTPVHVKAGLVHNWFLEVHKLKGKFPPLHNGDKIKWVYLQPNPFGLKSIAFRGYDDPKQLIEFADEYKEYEKTFDQTFITKIQSLYDAIGWGVINLNKNKNKFTEDEY